MNNINCLIWFIIHVYIMIVNMCSNIYTYVGSCYSCILIIIIHTFGKWSSSIISPLLNLRNDFTSPWCMNGIIMSNKTFSKFMLTPRRLSTLGWSSLLVTMHSSINVLELANEISIHYIKLKIYTYVCIFTN